jgi:hypothetical protein
MMTMPRQNEVNAGNRVRPPNAVIYHLLIQLKTQVLQIRLAERTDLIHGQLLRQITHFTK